jgi:hypothetical protein
MTIVSSTFHFFFRLPLFKFYFPFLISNLASLICSSHHWIIILTRIKLGFHLFVNCSWISCCCYFFFPMFINSGLFLSTLLFTNQWNIVVQIGLFFVNQFNIFSTNSC